MSGTPFLTSLRLKFVHRFRDRHGKTRHYFRRPGCKTVALPGLPGSAEFMAAYQAALAGHSAPRIEIGAAHTKPGTVAAAVVAYFGSIAFGNLAPCTKRTQRYILERFREGHGEKSFTGLERKHVEAMLAEKIATRTRREVFSRHCGRWLASQSRPAYETMIRRLAYAM